jgi:hypothetical protein
LAIGRKILVLADEGLLDVLADIFLRSVPHCLPRQKIEYVTLWDR